MIRVLTKSTQKPTEVIKPRKRLDPNSISLKLFYIYLIPKKVPLAHLLSVTFPSRDNGLSIVIGNTRNKKI